ncbi:MAG TPA: hypothetical protein ENG51_17210, partial [Deltaproteobacteria bacterium]|nr:hypothetical protein [Deltaproteobacteria bacterium]
MPKAGKEAVQKEWLFADLEDVKSVYEILKKELRPRERFKLSPEESDYHTLIPLLEVLIDLHERKQFNTRDGISLEVVAEEYLRRRKKDLVRESVGTYIARLKERLKRHNIILEAIDRRLLPHIDDNIKKQISKEKGKKAKSYFFLLPDRLYSSKEQERLWRKLSAACSKHNTKVISILKSYSDELYISRCFAESSFNSFLETEKNLFIVIGPSGKGKSNLIFHLAESLNCPSILLSGELYAYSMRDFGKKLNMLLEGFCDFGVLKKPDAIAAVNNIARRKQDRFVIFVDALDRFCNPAALWEDMVHLAVRLGESIKFCVSCRSEVWRDLLREKGIFVPVDQVFMEEPSEDLPCSLELTDFDEAEFQQATERYKEAFQCRGDISKQDLLKDPFLMRLLFETFQGSELPEHPFRAEVLQAYWQRKIERGREEKSEFIEKLAEYLLTHKQTHISYDLLRNQ